MEAEKNDIIELNVDGEGCDGEGVARLDGKAVFIRGAIKGERVRAKVIAVKPRFSVALLERVLSPSPCRASAECPLFGRCGGCDLQHMDYDYQLDFKRRLVSETLKKTGNIEVSPEPTEPSALRYRYRNKLSMPIRAAGTRASIGLFAKGSHRVVDVSDCLLQYEWNAPLISLTRALTEKYPPYNEELGTGIVRHLVARGEGGTLAVTIVATQKIDVSDYADSVAQLFPKSEVWLNINTARNNVILGERWILVRGGGKITEAGLNFTLHPAAFFQVNDDVRKKIYSFAAQYCRGGNAVEICSGAGLLSAALAREATNVWGIEIDSHAHEAALSLKRENALENFFPILGSAEEKLPEVMAAAQPEFAVFDPPRGGGNERILSAIVASRVPRLVYISCNPATLGRDLAFLLAGGYEIERVKPFDMFPQTANVETAAILRRTDKR